MAHDDLTEQDALDLIALGCALEGVPHLAPLSALAVDPYGEDCDSAPGLPVLRCEGDCGRVLVLGGRCPLCAPRPPKMHHAPEAPLVREPLVDSQSGRVLAALREIGEADSADIAFEVGLTVQSAARWLGWLVSVGWASPVDGAPGKFEALDACEAAS